MKHALAPKHRPEKDNKGVSCTGIACLAIVFALCREAKTSEVYNRPYGTHPILYNPDSSFRAAAIISATVVLAAAQTRSAAP